MKTHKFSSTGEAYDATQCDPLIQDGDMLIIKSEQVIGVAYCWPIAVTLKNGQLHSIKPDVNIQSVADKDETMATAEKAALIRGYHAAMMTAISEGYPISPQQAQNRIADLNEYIQHDINVLDSEREQQEEDERMELRQAVEAMMRTKDTIEAALYRQSVAA